METDLLIVGSGPAGLSAAIAAASYGADVILIEESFSLGGQLRQETQLYNNLPSQYKPCRGTTLLRKLKNQIQRSNIETLEHHTMIGTYKNGNIGVTNGTRTFEIRSKRNIIASGAAEDAAIFPGWTLPGVMTAGAAQILLNREFVLPGKQAIMLGSNEFAMEVSKQLVECGVSVKAMVEENTYIESSTNELISLLEQTSTPIYTGSTIDAATGSGELEKVVVSTPDGLKEIEADLVCIANGFTPILEPFEILGCELIFNETLGGWIPKYNSGFQTSNSSVYLAGNAAGITSIGAILLTGEIAAVHALESIGFISGKKAANWAFSLWNEMYQIEMKSDPATFQSRAKLIENVHNENGLPVPEYFNVSKGGMING
ncbi:NAD(P)/FAD-dependent oxidoreductase [Virgibacillus natechei]